MKKRFVFGIAAIINIIYYFAIASNIELDCKWVVLITLPMWVLLLIADFQKDVKKKRTFYALGVVGFFFLIIYAELIFVGGREQAGEDYSYIIVLGNGFSEDDISQNAKNRLDTAFEYGNDNSAIYVLAGGLKRKHTEAYFMKEYLMEKGVSSDRIILEDKSTDTYENLYNTYNLIGNQKVLLVTNRFHLWRSSQLAKSIGFTNVQQVHAPTEGFLLPYCYMREMGAIVREMIIGRIW